MDQAMRVNAQRVSGVPNLTFDLVSLLHNKLEAVAALEVYLDDARTVGNDRAVSIFEQTRLADLATIQSVRRLLRDELDATLGMSDQNTLSGGDLAPPEDLDAIDLEGDSSFPASDPPAFGRSTAEPD
jgi:hypothetical protein